MNNTQLKLTLDHLLTLPAETEVFEFKEAKNNFDFTKLGEYFSALANEANLKKIDHAWLIFGVKDKGRGIVGSSFRKNRADLDNLKGEIANRTTNRITFIEIHELLVPDGRVVMFQIPAAPRGIPVAFNGHYFGRDGEELSALNVNEFERIRNQAKEDWSAGICPDAGLEDLDPEAIVLARKNFKSMFPEKAAEVDAWNDITFLNKAKITIKDKITRTAIILLGREEAEHFIGPAVAKIRWILKDLKNQEKDHEVFSCPLLLAADKVFGKIRNLKYRYLQEGTLFPQETLRYEAFVIREALNNCIAHQDYAKGGRINVVEIEDDHLVFTNYGSFIPGSVEKVVFEDAPEEYYRNRFLANAMFNLKMVETAGGGIKKMFDFQRQRLFPMPDYDLSDSKVKVVVTGKVLDMEFARTLLRNPALTLEQIITLDKVQKRKPISDPEAMHLRNMGLIEGRKPNFIISSKVVSLTSNGKLKAQYIKHRGFDDQHYKKMIIEYIKKFKKASRKDIDLLLTDKLPEVISEKQKKNKITNLLSALRIMGVISNIGVGKKSLWVMVKDKI
ncbi:MAG: putative DNA binding domain-containing protein [Candidatus Wallbacteria bacterium]|nr:putative DNA binding domain-containing protein [Candidatus Wallbacteria bacterium]